MATAIIIDDLKEARNNLRRDLKDYCQNIDVIGEADGVVEGLKLIKTAKPEIVFLDIHLGDGTGFDILELLDNIDFKIIFTTASDAFAIRAFKFSAVDYLLKPFDPDDLMRAVEKAELSIPSDSQNMDLLLDNLQEKSVPKRIALHTQDKIKICAISDIVRCEASVNYTTFYFANGNKLMVTRTLKVFDLLLTEAGFFRSHQSHLINISRITELVKTDGGYLVMSDGSNVPISSRKRPELMQLLANIQ